MSRKTRQIIVFISIFVFALLLSFVLIKYLLKTGIKKEGKITFSSVFSEEQKSEILELFPNIELYSDVYISSVDYFERKPDKEDFLLKIYVPVTDFYSPEIDISSELFRALGSDKLLEFEKLTPDTKILSVDGEYFLDTMENGAKFAYLDIISLDERDMSQVEEIKNALSGKFNHFPKKSDILSFTQTGVTAMSRRMNTAISVVGDASHFISDNLKTFLKEKDLVHTSNESSFSEYADGGNICSDMRFVAMLDNLNLKIVELTGNHNLDCGIESALNTIDIYNERGIKIVGGGKNATDAAIPLEIKEKGTGITMLAFNYSTGGMTYGDTPGANSYNEEQLSSQIKEAKSKNNFVIVDIQFNECNSYANDDYDTTCDYADSSAPRDGYSQSEFFKHIADLGADIVVGTSAHQAQTFEKYGNSFIYYGLGNLLFDQYFWPDTARSLMLTHYFQDGKLLQTRISGTIYDDSFSPEILDNKTLSDWLKRLAEAR